jgi:uncharacterized pyridoxal phosphate-containing UPF0001 family protein
MAKSKRKTSRAKRVKREVESLAAVSKLTPAKLIRFCNELGLDLFAAEFRQRIDEIKKTPAAYRDSPWKLLGRCGAAFLAFALGDFFSSICTTPGRR